MRQQAPYRQCGNCGWGGPREDFTLSWCDDCAQAALKSALTTLVSTAVAALIGWCFR